MLAPRGETDLAPLNVDLKPPYTDESMGERMKPRQLLRVIRHKRQPDMQRWHKVNDTPSQVPSPRFRRMNYVESYPSVVSKPIQKWTLTEIGKNSTVTTTSLRETRSDSCSNCTKVGAISVEIRVTTRRLSPPIDDEDGKTELRPNCETIAIGVGLKDLSRC